MSTVISDRNGISLEQMEKLERDKFNNPEYWRMFYQEQEKLAKFKLKFYIEESDGGIRQQSTLPPKLNKHAHIIATELYYTLDKKC